MKLWMQDEGDVAVVGLDASADLMADGVAAFRAAFESLVTERLRVVLDLSRVDGIDSSGLGTLVNLSRWVAARGGELRLAAVSRPVEMVFEITRLYRLFEIYGGVPEAVASFEARA